MAKGKELDPSSQAVQMNLTPMIDCVFLLLTFFMIVSEMSSLNMEDLAPPHASEAAIDSSPLGRTLTVNIRKEDGRDGVVRVMGRKYDRDKLTELVCKEAIKSGRDYDSGHPGVKAYRLSVLIRCDRGAKYEAVQEVFDACSKNSVYRTTLAASPSTQ